MDNVAEEVPPELFVRAWLVKAAPARLFQLFMVYYARPIGDEIVGTGAGGTLEVDPDRRHRGAELQHAAADDRCAAVVTGGGQRQAYRSPAWSDRPGRSKMPP